MLADDEFYRALASTRRRRALSYLLAEEESTVDDLAAVLATWDATADGDVATRQSHQRIETSLVHVHLPMLSAVGLVEYDADDGTVSITALPDRAAALIRNSLPAED